jgi:hypothetical protein
MIDPLFTGSLVVASVMLPLLTRSLRVRWRYKAPACLILANIIPFVLLRIFEPAFHYGSTMGIAVGMHLLISFVLVLMVSAILAARSPA